MPGPLMRYFCCLLPAPSWWLAHFFLGFSAALLQSVPAVRVFGLGALNASPSSMMQGGTASVHFFKQTFAGALPQRLSKTWVLQQANLESWPRTFPQVG